MASAVYGTQKRKTADSVQNRTLLEESLLQSLCENCQRQICKTFNGLTIRAKMIGEGDPIPEMLEQTDRVGAKSPMFDLFARIVAQS